MSKNFNLGQRRIQRATDKEKLVEALTSEESGLFKEKWRLLIFAAALGFAKNRRERLLQVEKGRGIDQSSFSNCPAWQGLIHLMSLVESGTTTDLAATESAESARIQRFEEYANGGLALLGDALGKTDPSVPFMLDFIASALSPAHPQLSVADITI